MRRVATVAAFMALVFGAMTMAVRADEKSTRDDVVSRSIFRRPYDVNRDGKGTMHLDPLPFAKDRPTGAPDIDKYPAVGYMGDVALGNSGSAAWGVDAVHAGLCKADAPCTFSFVYVLSVQKSYSPGKLDDVGIRYVVTQGSSRTEVFIWGTQNDNQRYLRDRTTWRKATDPERSQMWYAFSACSAYHAAQVAAVQGP